MTVKAAYAPFIAFTREALSLRSPCVQKSAVTASGVGRGEKKRRKKDKRDRGAIRAYRDHLNALSSQLLGRVAFRVSRDAANSPLVLELGIVEEDLDDRAALLASRPKNGDDFLAGHLDQRGVT